MCKLSETLHMMTKDYLSSKRKVFYANTLHSIPVYALPGWRLSGVRGRAGPVSRAAVHEGHAQQTGRRLAVLLILVHVVLPKASHEQP